jgi:TrmH family RNA methyltransferase
MKRISSRQNPLVSTFRAVARGEREGLFLDGPHLVAEALASHLPVTHALITPEGLEREDLRALVERLDRQGADVVSATTAVMAAVSSVRSSSALVALAKRRETSPDEVFGDGRHVPLVLIACDVQDPGNVGAIVRVAEAAGATGVVLAGESANPFGPKALRGSMGSALRVPVVASGSAEAVSAARSHGCQILAAVPRGGQSMFDVDLMSPAAILVGGEGSGLGSALTSLADRLFSIPMEPQVESLNAAVAAALVLYEARRQRQHDRLSAR